LVTEFAAKEAPLVLCFLCRNKKKPPPRRLPRRAEALCTEKKLKDKAVSKRRILKQRCAGLEIVLNCLTFVGGGKYYRFNIPPFRRSHAENSICPAIPPPACPFHTSSLINL
jgi:hypothetical protein